MTAKMQEIDLDLLDPSPWNPRRNVDRDPHLQGLADSIRENGLGSPILVRPLTVDRQKRYQIVFGHRRAAATALAGLDTVTAMVRKLDDEQARDMTVIENLQREDLSPIEEAHGIHSLLGEDVFEKLDLVKDRYAKVADRLGKSPSWVARRARLCRLSSKWQAMLEPDQSDDEQPFPEWPSNWLEDVARLESETQDRLLHERFYQLQQVRSRGKLRALIEDYLHLLRGAPWGMDDAGLVPEAGACSECPSRSSQQSLLFVDDPDSVASNQDCCLNAACWERKKAAFVGLQKRQLAMEYGKVSYLTTNYQASRNDKSLTYKFEATTVKEGTKGARPALIVDGPEAGAKVWVKPDKGAKGADGEPVKRTLKEKKLLLDKRRTRRAIELFCELLDRSVIRPDHEELCRLLVVFGPRMLHLVGEAVWDKFAKLGDSDLDSEMWTAVKPPILGWLAEPYRNETDAWGGARILGEMLSIDTAALALQAREEHPEPKAWAKEKEAQKAKVAK